MFLRSAVSWSSRLNIESGALESILITLQVDRSTTYPLHAELMISDIYHSYLGLAALSIMKQPGLQPLDSTLCVSAAQRQRIVQLRKEASAPLHTYSKHGHQFFIHEVDSGAASRPAPRE